MFRLFIEKDFESIKIVYSPFLLSNLSLSLSLSLNIYIYIYIYTFQAAVVSLLLYGYTTGTLTECIEKKLDDNYTKMLRTILNKSMKQDPTKQQLYGHLTPISKTIQIRRTSHTGHCWRSKDELVSDILVCTPWHGRAAVGRPRRTYLQQLCTDTIKWFK